MESVTEGLSGTGKLFIPSGKVNVQQKVWQKLTKQCEFSAQNLT